MADDSKIVRAKENLKLNHVGSSYHRAIKEEYIAINRDWVLN